MSYAAIIQQQLQALGKIPAASPIAIEHSELLDSHLRELAAKSGGSLSFERFMQEVLYAPGLGYYSAGAEKIGESGDFITAPEISPMFSDCLAHQTEQILKITAGSILEIGAGRGIMAADILRRLEELECLPEQYLILEVSAELQQRQQQTLSKEVPGLFQRIEWISAVPENFKGVIIANEVVDAMPVQVFVKRAGEFLNKTVIATENGWDWGGLEFDQKLNDFGLELEKRLGYELAEGYESEANIMQQSWLNSLSDCLEQGLILLLDYGFPQAEYFHSQRPGTLMCHYRHFSHSNPLVLLGLQDVTAHVDFTALAEVAFESGLQVKGYTDQGTFLTNCGLLERMDQLGGIDDAKIIRYSQQVKLLILPSEMGELFKVIAMGRGIDDMELIGFKMGDKRSKL